MRSALVFIAILAVVHAQYIRTLHGFGRNNNGQLGQGDTTNYNYARAINVSTLGFERVEFIAAGGSHTLIMGGNGVLYSWGSNNRGQLGDGTTTTRSRPVNVDTTRNDWQIIEASNGDFNVAIRAGNEIHTWGFHSTGRLGLGSNGNGNAVTSPLAVNYNALTGDTIRRVAAGDGHVIVLGTSGKMYSWGLNDEGQLGDGTLNTKSTPAVVTVGDSAGHYIINIVSRGKHTLALSSSGTCFAWGSNSHGQLGIDSETETFRALPSRVLGGLGTITVIGVGARHSVVYNTRTDLYSFGDNRQGEIGLGSASTVQFQRHAAYSSAFVSTIRNDWEWVLDIQGGDGFTILFTDKWNLYGFGQNDQGQLGDGTTTTQKDGVAMQRTDKTSVGKKQVHGMYVGSKHVIFVASAFKWVPSCLLIVGVVLGLLL